MIQRTLSVEAEGADRHRLAGRGESTRQHWMTDGPAGKSLRHSRAAPPLRKMPPMSSLAGALVAVFMIAMGIGMAAIWTIDIARSPEVDRARGLLRARDRSTGSLLVPHWLAEYGTAALLVVGGAGLVLGIGAGPWTWLVGLGLGALAYSSLNSLGWALADRGRFAYAVPMIVGLVGAFVSLGLLVGGTVVVAPGS